MRKSDENEQAKAFEMKSIELTLKVAKILYKISRKNNNKEMKINWNTNIKRLNKKLQK